LLSDTGAPWDLVAAGDPRTYADPAEPDGLRWIAQYADGDRCEQESRHPARRDRCARRADDAGRLCACGAPDRPRWTFRNENSFLPANLRRPGQNGTDSIATGLDGLFVDFPDTAVLARTIYAGRGSLDQTTSI